MTTNVEQPMGGAGGFGQAPTHDGTVVININGEPRAVDQHDLTTKAAAEDGADKRQALTGTMVMFALFHLVQLVLGVIAYAFPWWRIHQADSINGPFKISMRAGGCDQKFGPDEVTVTTCEKYDQAFACYLSFIIASLLSTIVFTFGSRARTMLPLRLLGHLLGLLALCLVFATVALFNDYVDDISGNYKQKDGEAGFAIVIAVCAWSVFLAIFASIFLCCRSVLSICFKRKE